MGDGSMYLRQSIAASRPPPPAGSCSLCHKVFDANCERCTDQTTPYWYQKDGNPQIVIYRTRHGVWHLCEGHTVKCYAHGGPDFPPVRGWKYTYSDKVVPKMRVESVP